jgi:hypothetical protein
MPQALADDRHGDTRLQGEGRVGVAQIVQPDPAQTSQSLPVEDR